MLAFQLSPIGKREPPVFGFFLCEKQPQIVELNGVSKHKHAPCKLVHFSELPIKLSRPTDAETKQGAGNKYNKTWLLT